MSVGNKNLVSTRRHFVLVIECSMIFYFTKKKKKEKEKNSDSNKGGSTVNY